MITLRPGRENKKVLLRIEGLEQLTRRSIRHAWFDLGQALKKTASDNILAKPKHGRTYIIRYRSGRRRRHVASAAGESHANLTGKLRRSLGWKVQGSSSLEFGYGVTRDTVEYAPPIENGTRRMGARPSLRIAVDQVSKNAENYFRRRFEDESE